MKTNKAIKSQQEEQLEVSYTLTHFPTPENAPTRMSIKEFLSLPPFPVQRGHELRAKKLVPLLTEPMYGHYEVDVCIYEGESTMVPAPFKKEQKYTLNGHTRQYIWNERMKGNMVHNKVKHIPIPSEVVVNVYKFTDPQKAINFYYSRDSLVAVEKKPDLVTGALRANNIYANLQSTRIKKGLIATALDVACPWKDKETFRVPEVTNLIEQVSMMKETIIEMDKLDAPGKGAISTQYALGIAMLSGIYMDHDSKWATAINRLINADIDETLTGNDPIDWLIKANEGNPTGDASLDNALPYNTGLFNDRNGLMDYVSYCWRAYASNKKLDQAPTKKDITNSYSKLLNKVWDQEDDVE